MFDGSFTRRVIGLAGICLLFASIGSGDDPRNTRTVQVIERMEPSVVAIFTQPETGEGSTGSGSIIHETGFILTNGHVVQHHGGFVLLHDGNVRPYRTVGRMPEIDVAILQIPIDRPLTAMPLGRSHDLRNGEPVIAAGNPGGRGTVFSSGIVSGKSVLRDAPAALVMSRFKNDRRDRFIQFDAATNRGNSGGPLVNAEGKQIGVVAAKVLNEENINYAIPIDRVRSALDAGMAFEERIGFHTGLRLDVLSDGGAIRSVAADSAASRAGLAEGDRIISVQNAVVRNGIDWVLGLSGGRPGATWNVQYERDGKVATTSLELSAYQLADPIDAEGKTDGLSYSLFHTARLTELPKFDNQKPTETGVCTDLSPEKIAKSRADDYVIVFEGFLRFRQDGVYRLVVGSDDGSRVMFHGKNLIDNDGLHPKQERGAWVRVRAGLHPIRIEYLEASGDATLELLVESSDGKRREKASDSWFAH